MSSNANATSSPHAKRTSCVQEFIKHKYTAVAHGRELVKTEGVQENFYEGARGPICRLGCVDDAVGEGVFDQIRGGLEIEVVHDLSLMKLDGS